MRPPLNWGTGIALIYGVFASSTIGFVVFAMSQPVDLVSADYYQRALRADRQIEALANTRVLGEAFRVVPDVKGRALTLTLPTTPSTVSGTVTLYRPSDASADRQVPLRPVGGAQVVSLDGLQRGRWIAKVEWTADGAPFYYETPLLLP